MKAKINGIEVEGTKEEVAALIQMFGQQQSIPAPTYPYQPYIGTPWMYRPIVTCTDDGCSLDAKEALELYAQQMRL